VTEGGLVPVYVSSRFGIHLFSNSLEILVAARGYASLCRNEAYEFIFSEAIYGQRTLFEDIFHLDPASVFQIGEKIEGRVYRKFFASGISSDFNEKMFYEKVENYFENLRHFQHDGSRICCDLSAGYDTRTVASVLSRTLQSFSFNTNTNASDPTDHELAISLAEEMKIPIRRYDLKKEPFDNINDIYWKEAFAFLELARGLYRSASTFDLLARKLADADLFVGGYGGKLIRDKYVKYRSLDEFITSHYILPHVPVPQEMLKLYKDSLMRKFSSHSVAGDIQSTTQNIYYFERMRFWGGARIACFVTRAFHLHPLMDPELMEEILSIPLAEKGFGRLQKKMITHFNEVAARFTSGYGHSFVEDSSLSQRISAHKKRFLVRSKLHLKKVVPAFLDPRTKRASPQFWEMLAEERLRKDLVSFLGISEKEVYSKAAWQAVSQLFTVQRFIDKLEQKYDVRITFE